ncbi:hypothetical protein ACJ41O_000099 [Fusarium nematophilum]
MTSNPEFNSTTTGTEVATAFGEEIRGKNVVITGVSPSGIGESTAVAIASQAPETLVLASRTRAKVEQVASDIKTKYPEVTVKVVILDLSSIESIKTAAAEITSSLNRIDVLINNAGITLQRRDTVFTLGGIKTDLQLFTNHVGPFLFTELLLPKLLKAGPQARKGAPRIVNLSSHGHRLSPIRFSDYNFEKDLYEGVPDEQRPPSGVAPGFLQVTDGYPGFVGYGQSKTANILHAIELTRRLQRKGENLFALAVHPGTIDTGLSRGLDDQGRQTLGGTAPNGVWKSIDQGAATTIVGAFDPKLVDRIQDSASGGCLYLADCQPAEEKMAAHARDVKAAEKLWNETKTMLAIETTL